METTKAKCLICDKPEQVLRRGLCAAHYMRFRRALERVPIEQQDHFENTLIDAGQLLPSRQGRKANTDDPFAELADQWIDAATIHPAAKPSRQKQ